MRILVPAVKLYYRIGAKGAASVSSLLEFDLSASATNIAVNSSAKQVSFKFCLLSLKVIRAMPDHVDEE